jgi:cellulose biosynthesis protein BcsQ
MAKKKAKSKTSIRHPAIRIALYNHKGGVGKTTLTVNIAAALSDLGYRVLLVDADPQCNLTSYLVDPVVVDDWLDNSETSDGKTIWSSIKPMLDSDGDIRKVNPIELPNNIFLLPGDIRLSEYESQLSQIWVECFQRRVRGFKGATAISELVNRAAFNEDIDYIFYDVGPNIGPLNRVVLLDCDYFIVPAACDLFSTRALKTLGHALESWIKEWGTISQLAPDNVFLLPGRPKFLGYIIQKFRTYRGTITGAFSPHVAQLERNINSEIVSKLRQIDKNLVPTPLSHHKLGQVRDFSGLASQSQKEGKPFFQVSGAKTKAKTDAYAEFISIARKLFFNTRKTA